MDFGADDFQQVRVAASAYGLHVFGKVRIPALSNEGPAYVHFRAFTLGPDDQASLHAIRMFNLGIVFKTGLTSQLNAPVL